MLREGWFSGRRTESFTLQWHLTNACGFACRHCYDRSDRGGMDLAQALRVLDGLEAFGRRHRVRCQVCLSGGDPLLHPAFWEIYADIVRRGLAVSLLGNPVPAATISRLLAISPPTYYQVSLEGLAEHNDAIRGAGHHARTIAFLADARRLGLTTHVMLTLTAGNLDQVLPLAESLRGLTSRFTWNRLAQVGSGADLALPAPGTFRAFLHHYQDAARANPLLGLKDNLFNVLRHRQGRPYTGGCTGAGCGAAFNFVALLPDGEVHACRKYPSRIGSIHAASLIELHASAIARRHRQGPEACRGCRLKSVCGGCPAVSHGAGLDALVERDPCCTGRHTLS